MRGEWRGKMRSKVRDKGVARAISWQGIMPLMRGWFKFWQESRVRALSTERYEEVRARKFRAGGEGREWDLEHDGDIAKCQQWAISDDGVR